MYVQTTNFYGFGKCRCHDHVHVADLANSALIDDQ